MSDLFAKKPLWLQPAIFFLPFLALYIGFIYVNQVDKLLGDEGRYWDFGAKLLKGMYADDSEREYSFLWSGPGYPLTLAPFVYLKSSYVVPKILNAFYIYIGLIFLTLVLQKITTYKKSLFAASFVGLYYPFIAKSLPILITEALFFMVSCIFLWSAYHFFDSKKKRYLVTAAFLFAYLAMIKVIFGYVLMAMLFACGIWFLFTKNKMKLSNYFKILGFAFLFCIPWLSYTYLVSGKVMYWGNSGGMNLYWMSSPYENEQGDWHYFESLERKYPKMYENHKTFINSIDTLDPIAKDEALKDRALQHIKHYPAKFLKNWISSITRILFNYPHSYTEQSNNLTVYILWNSLWLLAVFLSLILTILNYKTTPKDIYFFLLIGIIYLGGVSLLAGLPRFLYPAIPFLLIWIVYMLETKLLLERVKKFGSGWKLIIRSDDS